MIRLIFGGVLLSAMLLWVGVLFFFMFNDSSNTLFKAGVYKFAFRCVADDGTFNLRRKPNDIYAVYCEYDGTIVVFE